MKYPKPKRYINEEYLNWIRMQPCFNCKKSPPSDPHHILSRGAGGSDLAVIPLCRICHVKYHAGDGIKKEACYRGALEYIIHWLQGKEDV
jgi:hypothetical protein